MTELNLLALAARDRDATPEALLNQLLPSLVAAIPTATACRVYRLATAGIVIWHSTAADQPAAGYQVVPSGSPYERAIDTLEPQVDSAANTAIVPLIGDGEAFALLVAEFDGQVQLDALVPLAADLALLLYNRQLRDLLDRQLTLTADLSAAQSLTDVAEIVARTMVTSGQFVTINVFEYDQAEQVAGARATASASANETRPLDLKIEVETETLRLMQELLTRDGHILIGTVEQEQRFSQKALEWLRAQRAQSIYVLPLHIHGQLYAFFTLIDTRHALALSSLEMRLYQSVARQASTMIEKNNLIERSRQRAEHSVEQVRSMRVLNDLIAAANVSNDEAEIFRRVAVVLKTTTAVDYVSVVTDRDDTALIVSEAPERGIVGQRFELAGDPTTAALLETREPLVVEDVANDSRLSEANRALLLEIGVQAVTFLPMFDTSGDLIGTVKLGYDLQQPIDPDLVTMANTVVQQVALAVQRVRLLAESRQQAEQLGQITEFGQHLRAYLSVPEILKTALIYSESLLGAHYMRIIIYDQQAAALKVVAEQIDQQPSVTLPGTRLDLEADTIAGQVWETRTIAYVDDLSADWTWQHPRQDTLLSLIVMPLVSAGSLIGLVEAGHPEAHAFNTVDITAFQQLGNQLSIALANAEAYAQSQRLARHKTLANEIFIRLQNQTEVDDILRLTVQELGKALNAKRARIRLGQPPQPSGDQA